MTDKLRYITSRSLKNEIVIEEVQSRFLRVRYRDSKNRIRKFSSRRKLRVEVILEIKSGNVTKTITSKSYGFKLRYRKRPASIERIIKQIQRKHIEKMKRGHLIIQFYDPLTNLYRWTYSYTARQEMEKKGRQAEKRYEKREAKKKLEREALKRGMKTARIIKAKGSKRENKKSRKN